MKHELQNIISGKSQVRHGDAIQAVASYIRRSKGTGCETKESKQIKIEEAIALTEIQHLVHKKHDEISDGQLQIALIARALAQDTSIIILDEPTTH